MSDPPTISEADVSPESPYLLMPASKFVVGERVDDGIIIHSQHRLSGPAWKSRHKLLRYSGLKRRERVLVYQVAGKDGEQNG